MATAKKIDKRSKEYRDSLKKIKKSGATMKMGKSKNAVPYTSTIPDNMQQVINQIKWIEVDPTISTDWNVTSIIDSIRKYLSEISKQNSRLTACVNSIVYIERAPNEETQAVKRSDTVTDSLDHIKWQLKEISEEYYKELDILEKYIGNTNKA